MVCWEIHLILTILDHLNHSVFIVISPLTKSLNLISLFGGSLSLTTYSSPLAILSLASSKLKLLQSHHILGISPFIFCSSLTLSNLSFEQKQ